jgi:hypothetical protein
VNILLLGVAKRKHVMGEWKKLLHNLYSFPGHVTCMEQGEKVYKVLAGKPEGKRPLGRWRRRREDGIRMDLRETGEVCELDSTSSGLGPVASYHISIHLDRLISICLGYK